MKVQVTGIRQELMRRVQEAEKSLRIACFDTSDPQFLELLACKVRQGLQVEIVTEGRKSQEALRGLTSMPCHNLKVYFSNPNTAWTSLHAKMMLIDDQSLLFGSFNIAESSLEHNDEILISSDDPRLCMAAGIQMKEIQDTIAGINDFAMIGMKQDATHNSSREGKLLWSRHRGHRTHMTELVLNEIVNAKRSCTVFSSSHIDREARTVLRAAAKRGVFVQIVKCKSAVQIHDLPARTYATNLIVDSSPGKMHIKAILIDESRYVVGSLNLFHVSMYEDLEMVLIGDDRDTYTQLEVALGSIVSRSMPLGARQIIEFLHRRWCFARSAAGDRIARKLNWLKTGVI